MTAPRVDPAQHDCPADGAMEKVAHGLGGQLWRCRRCHRPWTLIGGGFYEPRDAALVIAEGRR